MATQWRAEISVGLFERVVKLRYMGIGFVWAWLLCSYETSALFVDRTGLSINANESWLVSAATVIAVFFAGGVLLRRTQLRPLSALTLGAPLALSVGTVFSVAAGLGNVPAMWAGGVLTGVGYGLLCILWAMALFRLDIEELEIVIPLSSLIPLVCSLVVPALPGFAPAFLTAILPLISGMLLVLCLGADESARSYSGVAEARAEGFGVKRSLVSAPWFRYLMRASMLLVIVYIAIGWESACTTVEGVSSSEWLDFDFSALVSNLTTVILVIALVLFSRKVNFSGLFHWLLPLVIVSLVLFGLPGTWANYLGSQISTTCDTLVEILLCLFVLSISKTQHAPVSLGIGIANGFLQLGVLAGNLLGRACLGSEALFGIGGTNAFLICLVAMAIAFIPQREPGVKGSVIVPPTNREEAVLQACRRIQENYGLSDRETEIAALIAQGRTRPHIREQLFISSNTVATHIKHIYQKLDIHSKEELIDLVARNE